MANGRNGSSTLRLDWQNLIMTVGLLVVMVGGFWSLAYIPIQNNINDLKQQLAELRSADTQHFSSDESRFLTQKEHNEFKLNVHTADQRIDKEIDGIRKAIDELRRDLISRSDAQAILNTTRLEFLSEVKRLDDLMKDQMNRREFNVWKSERDKTIGSIQDRQNRFSEALDSMYSKLMQQMPSYQQK